MTGAFRGKAKRGSDRVMRSHRRYTSGNGDALSGAITYAVLVGAVPALALLSTVGGAAGNSVRTKLVQLLTAGSPDSQAALFGAIPAHPVITVLAMFVLAYSSLRLVRALRTGVRAMSGQQAGSGNPVADLVTDLRLGLVGLLGAALAVVLIGNAPAGIVRFLAATAATWALLVVGIRFGVRRGPQRADWSAAARAGAGGTGALLAVAAGAAAYLRLTEQVHDELFGVAGPLIGALVVVSASARIILRTASFAGTARTMARAELVRVSPQVIASAEPALHVIVPAHNEAAGIGSTLTALAAQSDRDFALIVVDSASTDDTAQVARASARALGLNITVVAEDRLGAGTAFDTGTRHAIAAGASMVLRTDADCLPRPDWVESGRRALTPIVEGGRGLDMACGRSTPRRDESPDLAERHLLPRLTRALAVYGRYRRAHRDQRYLAPYVLCHGHNIGLRTDAYIASGGAALHRLEEASEDVALLNRVRAVTAKVARVEDMVVENSMRRLRAYGIRNTMLWYWDRRYVPGPDAIHVR